MKKTRCLHASIAFVTSVGMKRFALLSICILIVSLFSCSEDREAQLLFDRVEPLIEEAPDSALALMDREHLNRAKLSKGVEAKYALFYSMAQDKSGLDVDDDSLLRIAYDYYMDRTSDSLYAKSQYYMGKCLLLNDSTYAAEMCFNHAIDRGKALKDYRTAYMACCILSISLAYSNTIKAIEIAKEGLKIQETYDRTSIANHVYLLLRLAETYMYTDNEKRNALPFVYEALNDAYREKDSVLIGRACHALSCEYMSLEQKDSALFYARESRYYTKEGDDSLNMLYAVSLFGADSIERSMHEFKQIAEKTESPNVRYTCYRYLLMGKLQSSHNTSALLLLDSIIYSMDKMYDNALELRNEYYESTIQKEKANTTLIGKSKKKDISIIILVSLSLVVIAITSLLYIYNKKESKRKMQHEKQRHQLELQHKEEEKRREHEFEAQSHRIEMEAAEKRHQEELATSSFQINLMRNHLLSKLAFMKKIARSEEENKAIKLTDEDWKEIEDFLNGSDTLFVERIREKYPDMSKKDLQFCMLLRLRCTTQDLMNIYCINEQSVKQKKYKFKAKLGIMDAQISAKQFISEF